jgi:hypothetical protein
MVYRLAAEQLIVQKRYIHAMKKARILHAGFRIGGDKEARTPDIQLAKLALYQLSYVPKCW